MSTGTYVYCLIAAPRRPALASVPAGLAGTGPVRLLDVDGGDGDSGRGKAKRRSARQLGQVEKWWLAVADAPLVRYGEAPINRRLSDLNWVSRAAIAHEAVVESFIGAPALVPMKLFTIFASDARALEHLRVERRRVNRVLQRVKGHDEWGVRMILEPAHPIALDRRDRSFQSGTAYLSMKKGQRDRSVELSHRARDTGSELYDRLVGCAAASKQRTSSDLPGKSGALLFDAAFLVRRSRATPFRRLVARAAKALTGQGYRVTLSGPWPPYSFIQD
jgi:Gas vesicle synthesis protein GvpL/GvpF